MTRKSVIMKLGHQRERGINMEETRYIMDNALPSLKPKKRTQSTKTSIEREGIQGRRVSYLD